MFFLLRIAFWLGVVCVLLPNGGAPTKDANVDTAGAVSAASAAVSDAAVSASASRTPAWWAARLPSRSGRRLKPAPAHCMR